MPISTHSKIKKFQTQYEFFTFFGHKNSFPNKEDMKIKKNVFSTLIFYSFAYQNSVVRYWKPKKKSNNAHLIGQQRQKAIQRERKPVECSRLKI
jgi:hypothetical protein